MWHARWLANARSGFDNDLIWNAFEAELQPSLEHINEVTSHVVPMPAGLRFKRLDGADVFGADPATRGSGEAKIAIFDVGARPFPMKGILRQRADDELGLCVRQR